jgi:peptidoglycan/LPS O-acetylase OafA/YrhL
MSASSRLSLAGLPARLRRVTRSGDYIAEIDGLRFFAIVPVIMFHLMSRSWRAYEKVAEPGAVDTAFHQLNNLLWAAKSGVELFFVISGFIIAYPFVAHAAGQRTRPRLGAFYARRLTRLEPPYIVATLGVLAFLLLTGTSWSDRIVSPHGDYSFGQGALASLVYMHGLFFQELPDIIPVTWSLEVEFQFYTLAPLMFAAYFLVRNARLRALCGAVAIVGLVAAINPLQAQLGDLIRFILPRFLHLFLAGVVLCDLIVRHPPAPRERRPWGPDLLFPLGLIVVVATEPLLQDYREPTFVLIELVRVSGFAGMFLAAFYGRYTPRMLSWPWLPAIGGMCYTLYLTHLPIQEVLVPLAVRAVQPDSYIAAWLASAAVSLPVVAVVGVAFYLLIEKPCMRRDWPQRLAARVRGVFAPQAKPAPGDEAA